MRRRLSLVLLYLAFCSVSAWASDQLVLPASGLSVDLESGAVTSRGITGQCLEVVSKAGPNLLVVQKAPGDDAPTVTVNGEIQSWVASSGRGARLGGYRLSRDGSLSALRTWKTGAKQTELMSDGEIIRSWPRGTSVKLLAVDQAFTHILEDRPDQSARLVHYSEVQNSGAHSEPETLVDFGTCQPGRLRLNPRQNQLWAELKCAHHRGSSIHKISLEDGQIGSPLLTDQNAEFISLPTAYNRQKGQTFAVVSGTQSALHFYYAVRGLLLSQTGEVRACSSDAEGLQSWNQSYRVRALATLYAKTGDTVFADLALKSMRLTLQAQDGSQGRTSEQNPACGWSSTIYSGAGERLSLMINQAFIANSLSAACDSLGAKCPLRLRSRIANTNQCLATRFERDFDPDLGLYRIQDDIEFRFAGAVAPWNWQISFAALLKRTTDADLKTRGHNIVRLFLSEWAADDKGALWRYWPNASYWEQGLSEQKLAEQRFEDTGHAGISLLSLASFDAGPWSAVQQRLDFLLSQPHRTSRDLDGSGPQSARWFPAGGWAHAATKQMQEIYQAPVPGSRSADTLYAYSVLFQPEDRFDLTYDIFVCTKICEKQHSFSFASWKSFLNKNALFEIR